MVAHVDWPTRDGVRVKTKTRTHPTSPDWLEIANLQCLEAAEQVEGVSELRIAHCDVVSVPCHSYVYIFYIIHSYHHFKVGHSWSALFGELNGLLSRQRGLKSLKKLGITP